jgi:circadian clock protein KaiB
MPEALPQSAREHFERAIAALETEPYALTLFVSGASDSSAQAIANIRDICDGYLEGRYSLDIVDLHQEPGLAAEHHVLATPTLIKDHPLPSRMLVGDMSDHPRVLIALDVRGPAAPNPPLAGTDTSGGK